MGVKDIFIDDLREEFVRDYVFPMFRANALYEGTYLLGTSIARYGAGAGGLKLLMLGICGA
jgi:argininosuccinate synthase